MVHALHYIPVTGLKNFHAGNMYAVSVCAKSLLHSDYQVFASEKRLCNGSIVCGKKGNSYQSLCDLYDAGDQIAYYGTCRPQACKGQVCGIDKNTYESACHARAHNTRVDYAGKCFSIVR